MKYDNVPKEFHSPYMKQVAEKLSILKMTDVEKDTWNYYKKKLYSDRDELAAAINRGLEQGIEQGIPIGEMNKSRKVASSLLKAGVAISIISLSTGLSEEEILALNNKS